MTHPDKFNSMSETAYRHLRAEIVSCHLAPGQRLTEKQLAADTGFGFSPIRDALTRLDHEGLVRTLPRKGYQVTPLTLKSVDDLFVIWRIVGPELVRLGVARASDEELAHARAGFDAVKKASHEGSGVDAAVHLINAIEQTFRVLAHATSNDYVGYLYDRVSGDMSRVWLLILEDRQAVAAILESIPQLDGMLELRDADTAADNACAYITESYERILKAIMRRPLVMSSEIVPLKSASSKASAALGNH